MSVWIALRGVSLLAVLSSFLLSTGTRRAHAAPRPPKTSVVKPLPRGAMFGATLAPLTKEERARHKLDKDVGVVIAKIFPGTSAAKALFEEKDVILTLNGAAVTNIPMFFQKVAAARAGDVMTFDYLRDGVKHKQAVTFSALPREQGDGYEVIYGQVMSRGARLRTIVTRPKAPGRHPAVLLLQGYGCFSIDNPVGTPTGFTRIARDLASHGYVTMRVDRPGCGDSEGGPCRDVDFETELGGYRQALKALRQLDFVDAENLFLFGHSLGGSTGPMLACEMPVRGLAIYGASSETWLEGILGQRRRWATLDGTSPKDVERKIFREMRFWYPLLAEKKTPAEILKHHPELRKTMTGMVEEDTYVGGRHFTFLHQVFDKNMGEIWTRAASTPQQIQGKAVYPRVLAMWGTSDWVVAREPNVWIAEMVNRARPGNGRFVELKGIDHYFLQADSPQESFRFFRPTPGTPAREFNPVILETLRRWLAETRDVKESPFSGERTPAASAVLP